MGPERVDPPVKQRLLLLPKDGPTIGSMALSSLYSDEDLLYEQPLVRYVDNAPAYSPPAVAAATVEAEDEWLARTMWEATCVAFGAEFGNIVGGGKAMAVVCGTAAFVWSRRRWP